MKRVGLEVVARDGIEPPTPAFSGPESVRVNCLKTNLLGAFFTLKNDLLVQPIATHRLVSDCSIKAVWNGWPAKQRPFIFSQFRGLNGKAKLFKIHQTRSYRRRPDHRPRLGYY